MTFTTKDEVEGVRATIETDSAVKDQSNFLRYNLARRVRSYLFDHTKDDDPMDSIGYAVRLNGSENEKIGLAKSLSVMPGDTVRAEVYAKYVDPDENNLEAALETLLGYLANPGSSPAGTIIDGTGYMSSGSTSLGILPIDHTEDTEVDLPKAYLNYIFINKNFDLWSVRPLFQRIDGGVEDGSDGPHAHLTLEDAITEPGYVYVYLSNDGEEVREVYFDDFKVEHVKSPVISAQDYYPFGLTYNNYSRENSLANRWKFQGQEHVDDLGLNWDSFRWRNHQPEIGRFFNVDPLAMKYLYNSPYAFSENKVVAHTELEGLESKPVNEGEDLRKLKRAPSGPNSYSSTVSRSGQNIQVKSLNKSTDVFHTSKIKVQGDVNPKTISDKTAKVVGENMANSGNSTATVTSSVRNSNEQASVMYKNAENLGVAHEYNLYGSGGDKVVDTYVAAKSVLGIMESIGLPAADPASIIKGAMEATINSVGLTNVTNHGGDYNVMNVIDISAKSISNPVEFHNSLQSDSNIKRALTPYTERSDPAFHVEVLQNP
jgi:RHS repeat-associated protein